MAASISQKIEEYWEIMDCSSIASAILDPRTKLSVFSEENEQSAYEHIQAIFETYQEHSFNTNTRFPRRSSSTTNATRQFFTQLLRNPTTSQVASAPLPPPSRRARTASR